MSLQTIIPVLINVLICWTLLSIALGTVFCRMFHLRKVANNER